MLININYFKLKLFLLFTTLSFLVDITVMDPSSSVQQWVDKIQPQQTPVSIYSPRTKSAKRFLSRDWSFQSDESQCSSLESVLEMRKPDPEEVLLELGFGPRRNAQNTSRIPERFLQPSTVSTQCVNKMTYFSN